LNMRNSEQGICIPPKEKRSRKERSRRAEIFWHIPVDELLAKYEATRKHGMPHIVERTIRRYPTLAYLFGTVSEPLDVVFRNSSIKQHETVSIVNDGSGMFGLRDPEDAGRWLGIINHSVGSVENAIFLGDKLKRLTKQKRKDFEALGIEFSLFDTMSIKLLRDGWLLFHAGQRKADETTWYELSDTNHNTSDPYESTLTVFHAHNIDPVFFDLLKIEKQGELVRLARSGNPVPAEVAVMVLGDFLYEQTQMTVSDHFKEMRQTGGETPDVLFTLEKFGERLEHSFSTVLGNDIFDRMRNAPEPIWATRMHRAYAASSGMTWDELSS